MIRSIVLPPIEPVAPSSVTLRSFAEARCLDFAAVSTAISSPHQQPARGGFDPAVHNPNSTGKHGRGDETIKPIHQARRDPE